MAKTRYWTTVAITPLTIILLNTVFVLLHIQSNICNMATLRLSSVADVERSSVADVERWLFYNNNFQETFSTL